MLFQFTILTDIITRKVRFPAVSTPECNLIDLLVYIDAPRKNTVSRNGVELLTNIGRIGTTLTIENLICENFLTMVTDRQQNNNARIGSYRPQPHEETPNF